MRTISSDMHQNVPHLVLVVKLDKRLLLERLIKEVDPCSSRYFTRALHPCIRGDRHKRGDLKEFVAGTFVIGSQIDRGAQGGARGDAGRDSALPEGSVRAR